MRSIQTPTYNTGGVAANASQILRKTYALLAATLLFSGFTASVAMAHNARPMNGILFIIGYFGLLFLTTSLRKNKIGGLVSVFALTGFMGYFLGPVINFYLHAYTNGGQLVLTALGGTGAIFLGLSAYALISRKNFSYLAGFLFAGIMGVFILSIAGFFFHSPMLNLVISAAFILLSSGLILFQTSQIINGGETSYIMATIGLYVALFNLFISLLNILSAFSGKN
jgi:modulator of FtsH protease